MRPSPPRALEVGDVAPAFQLKVDGEAFDPAADHVVGRPLLLVFQPGGAPLPDGLDTLAARLSALRGRCVVVAATAGAVPAGFELAVDADGKVGALYGASDAARIVLIAPNRRVAAIGADPVAASRALERIAYRRTTGALTHHPPVLMLPDVLSPADCQRLIGVYAMQGHTFVEPGHGASPAGIGDYKMRIPEYGRKDRIDHWIMTPETNAFIDDRLKRRLFGEIHKCFQYKITRREGYRIGCYEGERGGELHGHRDNSQPNVAHRRFACSINLNSEQYDGGGIRFPEFGDQEYRPETGMAAVFSSSLLHEPMHVTRGKRYVLLAFLYGEQ
jgi:hypothetical protein